MIRLFLQYRRIYTSFLVTQFCKHTERPLHALLVRLSVAYGLAAFIGYVIQRALQRIDLPADLPLRMIVILYLTVALFMSGLIFLTLATIQSKHTSQVAYILRLTPLPKVVRYFSQLLPSLLIVTLLIVIGLMPVKQIAQDIQRPEILLSGLWVIGLLLGLGISRIRIIGGRVSQVICFVTLIVLAVLTIEWMYSSDSNFKLNILPYGVIMLLFIPLIGLAQEVTRGYELPPISFATEITSVMPSKVPFAAWFLVKLWRNRQSYSSFTLSLMLSCICSLGIIFKQKSVQDPYQLLLFGAIISTAFSTEIRGLVRRFVPPEGSTLNGLLALIRSQQISVLLVGFILSMPLFFSLNSVVQNSVHFAVFYVCLQIFACIAGQFSGAWFVPSPGEIGSQFFATCLASGLLFLVPKIAHFDNRSVFSQSVVWLLGAIALLVATVQIELIRRRRYGRT